VPVHKFQLLRCDFETYIVAMEQLLMSVMHTLVSIIAVFKTIVLSGSADISAGVTVQLTTVPSSSRSWYLMVYMDSF
jgi:hypothetical protein